MTPRSLLVTLFVLGFAGWSPAAGQPRIVMMASTIGPIDAGIVAALEDAYFARSGAVVRHAGAGTGAALEMSKGGSFDLVMVHARAPFLTRGDRSGTHVKVTPLFFPNSDEWRNGHGGAS